MRLPCSYLAHLVIMSLLPFVKLHAGGRILFRAKSTEGGDDFLDNVAVWSRGHFGKTERCGKAYSLLRTLLLFHLGLGRCTNICKQILGIFFGEFRILRNSSFRVRLSDKAKPTQDPPLLHLWTGVQISAEKFWNFWECCFLGKLSGAAKHTQDPPPLPPLDRWTNICRESLLSDCKTNVSFSTFWFHIVLTFPTINIMLLERFTNIYN